MTDKIDIGRFLKTTPDELRRALVALQLELPYEVWADFMQIFARHWPQWSIDK